jgi:hypothetical protein
MLTFSNVVHLLTNKLTRLCARRLSFTSIFMGTLDSLIFRHFCASAPCCPLLSADRNREHLVRRPVIHCTRLAINTRRHSTKSPIFICRE